MKNLNFIAIILLFCGCNIQNVNSYRILCAYSTPSPSHYFVAEALMKGLAEKGHDVTVITTFPSDYTHPNFRQIPIKIPDDLLEMAHALMKTVKGGLDLLKLLPKSIDFGKRLCEILFNNVEVQKIMQEESFDLFITEAVIEWALLGLGAHFNCPTITIISITTFNCIHEKTGNPLALPYISNGLFSFPTPFTFKYRVFNFLAYILHKLFFESMMYILQKRQYEEYFPSPRYPSFDEMVKNVSLTMIADHFSQGNVRPYVPTLVEIGGIQMKEKPAPLPSDLQKFMDNSTNGVIYFSFGSNLKSSTLSMDLLNDLAKAFGRLHVNVLWKFENGTLPDIPKNIRLEKWLPQDDILQHKNLKLFISHGGLGSVAEAKYHGVPLVLIPVFADQYSNANKVEKEELGVQLPFSTLTGDSLSKAVNEVLSNPKYINKAKYQSMLYRDRPNTALETGIFWTEYVIRHRGAKHLQSNAVHLNFFQFHSLDVIGFLALVVLFLLFCIYKSFGLILRRITKKFNKSKIE